MQPSLSSLTSSLTSYRTGGTGYIGGSVLHTIYTAHPDWSITALLRRVPDNFTTCYPNITIVKGDYDSTDLLSSNAETAHIVVHCGDSDHENSLNALLAGLLRKSTPGYLIHLSGTGVVSDWRTSTQLGQLSPKIWSDIISLREITSLPDGELHRNTEKILHDTIAKHAEKINIAIMCPPDIYGRGKGIAKTHSALIPMLVHEIRTTNDNRAFYLKDGTNTRSWVHVDDLMRLYLHLVEAAASPDQHPAEEYFNGGGYYFAATQEHSQLELAKATGAILYKHGIIQNPEPEQVALDRLDAMANLPGFPKLSRYLFASNSRTRPKRAEKVFGYKGEALGLMEVLEQDILDAVQGK
jgi:nucleoside-diphosphate-sugar epimerase